MTAQAGTGRASASQKVIVRTLSEGEPAWHTETKDGQETLWATNWSMDNHYHNEKYEAQKCEYASIGMHLFHYPEDDWVCAIIRACLEAAESQREKELKEKVRAKADEAHRVAQSCLNRSDIGSFTHWETIEKDCVWFISLLDAHSSEGEPGPAASAAKETA